MNLSLSCDILSRLHAILFFCLNFHCPFFTFFHVNSNQQLQIAKTDSFCLQQPPLTREQVSTLLPFNDQKFKSQNCYAAYVNHFIVSQFNELPIVQLYCYRLAYIIKSNSVKPVTHQITNQNINFYLPSDFSANDHPT